MYFLFFLFLLLLKPQQSNNNGRPTSSHNVFHQIVSPSAPLCEFQPANNRRVTPQQQQQQQEISSPICAPPTGLSLINLQQNNSQQFQMSKIQPQKPVIGAPQNLNRQSFHGNRSAQTDRKPEELDAVANDLLQEFVLKPKPANNEARSRSPAFESDSGTSTEDEDNDNLRDDGTLPVSQPSSKPLSM